MGIPVLILGESGTGKTCSLRNFTSDEISLVNVDGKPLPFREQFKKVICSDNAAQIMQAIAKSKSKVIVIDDAQYIMANEFMRRTKENGFNKFSEIGCNFWNLIESVKRLPVDVIVYFLMHTEETNTGIIKAKTIGKMLDEKISLEGKFTIVLRTQVTDGQYTFTTVNNGSDTVKAPMGMFEPVIENDLKAVDMRIREYYQLGGHNVH